MRTEYLKELIEELELLKEDYRIDTETMDIVLLIINEYRICEEGYNLGMKLQERTNS